MLKPKKLAKLCVKNALAGGHCAHAVAVGEKLDMLPSYTNLVRRSTSGVNYTALVTIDSDKGVGKKRNRPSTSRRRRGRSGNDQPSLVVDRCSRSR